MAGEDCSSVKLKRKVLDRVNDESSDFSFSSPAFKIRRLNAELPPIMEEDEPQMSVAEEQVMAAEPVVEELETTPVNEERALVLFKPVNSPTLHSSSGLSPSIHPDFISGFKNNLFGSNSAGFVASMMHNNANDVSNKGCLAVVPWVDSSYPRAQISEIDEKAEGPDEMEADEMDVEDDNRSESVQPYGFGEMCIDNGFCQWPQPHCEVLHLPQNTSTPITWFL